MYERHMDALCNEMLEFGMYDHCDKIYQFVERKWGIDKVLRFKIENDVALETEELQLMYNRAFPENPQTLIA